MVPFDWNEHKSLFTDEQQCYMEEMALSFLDSRGLPRTPERVERYITSGDMIFRSTIRDDSWYLGADSPFFKNMSYGLNTDIFIFMDKIAVAIAERKKER